MTMTGKALVLAFLCALAAHGAVEAGRMGPIRKLSQVPGGMGGVYASNGNGIVVVNTVVYVNAVVITDTGFYGDGTVVFLEGGIVFGSIYGGIIYPPNQAQYYPTAIVAVVVFGPVFAQSWFIGPSGVVVWSTTIFYRAGGVRIYNPSGYNGPFYNSAGAQLGSYSNSVPRIESNTVIQQNNVNINVTPPPRQVTTPAAAGKAPISSAIGQQGVTVSPGAAPGGSPGLRSPGTSSSPDSRSPGFRSPGTSSSPDSRSPGFRSPGTSSSPDSRSPANRSPENSASPDANRRSGSPSGGGSPDQGRSPAFNGSPDQNRGSPSGGGNDRRNNGSPDPSGRNDGGNNNAADNSGNGGGGGGGGDFSGGGGDRGDRRG